MRSEASAIDALWPSQASGLDDDAIIAAYERDVARAWVRVNFVSSIDGWSVITQSLG